MGFTRSTHLLMSLSLEITVLHKHGPTCASGTDSSGEFSNDLTQIVNFPTSIPGCDSHSPANLNIFLSFDTSICSTMAFPPLGNPDHAVGPVSTDFPSKP